MSAPSSTTGPVTAALTTESLPTKADYLMYDKEYVFPPPEDPCPVCLEPFGKALSRMPDGLGEGHPDGCAVRVSCGHIVGGDCLAKWAEQDNRCPLCRTDLFIAEEGPPEEPEMDWEAWQEPEEEDERAEERAQLAQDMEDAGLQPISQSDNVNIMQLSDTLAVLAEARARGDAPEIILHHLRGIRAIQESRFLAIFNPEGFSSGEDSDFIGYRPATVRKLSEMPSPDELMTVSQDIRLAVIDFFEGSVARGAKDLNIWKHQSYHGRPGPHVSIALHCGAIWLLKGVLEIVGMHEGERSTANWWKSELKREMKRNFRNVVFPRGMQEFAYDLVQVALQAGIGQQWEFVGTSD